MSKKVIVTVTSQVTGNMWALSPYNPQQGVIGAPEYLVPTYKLKVVGEARDFQVIRFGIKRTNVSPPPETRLCDVGLFKENTYTGTWLPTYRVHSGSGSLPGAWQLYGNFLIHEGSPDPNDAWGTYGCIEVVGRNEWRRYLRTITRIGEAQLNQISKQKNLIVRIKAAAASNCKT